MNSRQKKIDTRKSAIQEKRNNKVSESKLRFAVKIITMKHRVKT